MAGSSRRYPVAIAHDYLTQRGGAERVVLAMSRAFPEAPIYTLLYEPEGTFPEFRDKRIVTSPLNRIGPLRRHHRAALPFLAYAASRFRVPADVVIASSSGWAHGFRTDGRLVVYCHNPARWLYQPDEYLGRGWQEALKRAALAPLKPPLIRWDRKAAARADRYLANSSVVRDRIRAVYGIEAEVVFPPAGVKAEGSQDPVQRLADWAEPGYHLVVSRLLPYKNVDVVVEAFDGLGERLVIVGRGPEEQRLRSKAGPNVRFLADLSDAQLRWTYAHATAVIAPSYEDFGLTPLEANAFAKPVLALRAGGYLDTVLEGRSGLFFNVPDVLSLRAVLVAARHRKWQESLLTAHATQFSPENFSRELWRVSRSVAPGTGATGRP